MEVKRKFSPEERRHNWVIGLLIVLIIMTGIIIYWELRIYDEVRYLYWSPY